jgi:hypothetical protein
MSSPRLSYPALLNTLAARHAPGSGTPPAIERFIKLATSFETFVPGRANIRFEYISI